MAAEGLYYYLADQQPDANIILLGDYNDDVDESLYYDSEDHFGATPYDDFVDDSLNFSVVTGHLSEKGESSSVDYRDEGDLIDHITISDELFGLYIPESADVYDDPLIYIPDYESTASDHLPVWAKFDLAP